MQTFFFTLYTYFFQSLCNAVVLKLAFICDIILKRLQVVDKISVQVLQLKGLPLIHIAVITQIS